MKCSNSGKNPPNPWRPTQDQRKAIAMRGIETAFWAVLGHAPELRTSKTGKSYCTFSCVVTVGGADDDKDVSQWLRVCCFGETAEIRAARAKKRDRIYVEGTLTLNTWENANSETKTGLNVAAWKCEKVAGIGRSRVRQAISYEPDEDEPDSAPIPKRQEAPAKAPKSAKAPKRREFEFDDKLTF